jgi:hypothetical protein
MEISISSLIGIFVWPSLIFIFGAIPAANEFAVTGGGVGELSLSRSGDFNLRLVWLLRLAFK